MLGGLIGGGMVSRRALLGAAGVTAGVAVAGGVLLGGVAAADAAIVIKPDDDFGAWEGWGTSLAWWANLFGDRDDLADLFFTTRTVRYDGLDLPGLGLNIARYNLGACSRKPVNGEAMVASPNIPAFKQIEGYWQGWGNADPTSPSWNWKADSMQRAALVKATRRGAIAELFANSPMWWMCQNHNPSGAADGGDNLQPWNYAAHATHLAVTARRARDRWGVTFRTVDPFNEPSSPWWTATGGQEGCRIDASVQRTVIAQLRAALDAQGLAAVGISASDENTYDLARETWNSFDEATRAAVRQVNVHGYQGANGRRDLLYAEVSAAGKALWMSETGDDDRTGLAMAQNLCLDWTWLHPSAWVYWQVMDPTGGWGLIQYDPDTRTPGVVNLKYFVLAQFTRHIRPGMRILDTGADNAVAAYDAGARRLVVVAVNTGPAQEFTFDLSAFGQVDGRAGGRLKRWTTVPGDIDRYTERTDVRLTDRTVRLAFPAGSVQTLHVDGVLAS